MEEMGFQVSFVYSGRHAKHQVCESRCVDPAVGPVEGRVTWTCVYSGQIMVKDQIQVQVGVADYCCDVSPLLWYSLGDGDKNEC